MQQGQAPAENRRNKKASANSYSHRGRGRPEEERPMRMKSTQINSEPASPSFLANCVINGGLALLKPTHTRKLDASTRKAYLTARRRHDHRLLLRDVNPWPGRTQITVPLSIEDQRLALSLARGSHPRRQNWEPSRGGKETSVREVNHGRYSSRCAYDRWGFVPTLKSFAIISRWGGRAALYRHHCGSSLVPAPRGWRWSADANGLRLVSIARPTDDFHPDSGDLRKGIRHIVHQAVVLREKRRAEAAKTRREKRLLLRGSGGVRVGLRDSLDAGNCPAGSLEFARRHGLDPDRRYAPARLLRLEPDNDRLKLAIAVAIRRHAKATPPDAAGAGSSGPNSISNVIAPA